MCFYLFTLQCIQNSNTSLCKHSRLFTAQICMTSPLKANGSSLSNLAETDTSVAKALIIGNTCRSVSFTLENSTFRCLVELTLA